VTVADGTTYEPIRGATVETYSEHRVTNAAGVADFGAVDPQMHTIHVTKPGYLPVPRQTSAVVQPNTATSVGTTLSLGGIQLVFRVRTAREPDSPTTNPVKKLKRPGVVLPCRVGVESTFFAVLPAPLALLGADKVHLVGQDILPEDEELSLMDMQPDGGFDLTSPYLLKPRPKVEYEDEEEDEDEDEDEEPAAAEAPAQEVEENEDDEEASDEPIRLDLNCRDLPGLKPPAAQAVPLPPDPFRGQLTARKDRPLYPSRLAVEIWLELAHLNSGDQVVGRDVALFTIPPLIFSSDVDPPERVIVAGLKDIHQGDVGMPGNLGMVGDLVGILEQRNIAHRVLDGVEAAPNGEVLDRDRWVQDPYLTGFRQSPGYPEDQDEDEEDEDVQAPSEVENQFFLLKTSRWGHFLDPPDEGWTPYPGLAHEGCQQYSELYEIEKAKDAKDHTPLDYGGNVVVSPPVAKATAKIQDAGGPEMPAHPIAPYGKILLGDDGTDRQPLPIFRQLLEAQKVQPVVPVDTSWLRVAHTDEIVNFVRDGNGTDQMLLAWPDVAMHLMGAVLETQGEAETRGFRTRSPVLNPPEEEAVEVVTDGTEYDFPLPRFELSLVEALSTYHYQNTEPWRIDRLYYDFPDKLDKVRGRLETALDLTDVLELPVLFHDSDAPCSAITPNLVNSLILGTHVVMPKPWAPRVPVARAATALSRIPALGGQVSEASLAPLRVEYFWKKPGQALGPLCAALACPADPTNVTTSNGGRPHGWSSIPALWGAVSAGWLKLRVQRADVDIFEAYVYLLFQRFGLTVDFLDDWDQYHIAHGEIHCGTNAYRTPPNVAKKDRWWNHFESLAKVPSYG